ncbi:hypothetical protein R3P38DRAFT_3164960 [Favolaschia claudopus]|uniref:Uncharacterized protein n=1 Tax=Favolaschia claudopus TaxID=2862362 RepID=A0AAW0EIF3_9AGAR
MPPKKKNQTTSTDNFRVPGTPATKHVQSVRQRATKAKKKKTVDDTDEDTDVGFAQTTSTNPRHRNIAKQVVAHHGTHEAMVADTANFDTHHMRPIALSSKNKLVVCKRFFVQWFTQFLGSEDAAEAMLVPKSPFPPLAALKQYIYFLATTGKSHLGIEGVTGWSMHTTQKFLTRTFSMANVSLKRAGVAGPTQYDKDQLNHAVATWGLEDEILNTHKKTKRIIREHEFRELLAACLKPGFAMNTNHMRLTMMAFVAFLYTHGTRPSTILELPDYKGLGQYLKWGDSEWVLTGSEEGAGTTTQSFWTFHWNKGQRSDKSLMVKTTMRNLSRGRIDIDGQLLLEALAIKAGIFEEDLLELRAKDPKTLSFPIRLTIKESARDLAVFLNAKRDGPFTTPAAQAQARRVKKFLNWDDFTLYTMRYSFASAMIDLIPKAHLRYFMGHHQKSYHAFTTYQAPDRGIDVSGTRFGEANVSSAQLSEDHSSVSWNRPNPAPKDEVFEDPLMAKLVADYVDLETEVQKKYGAETSSRELYESGEHNTTTCVRQAIDALAQALEYYLSLSNGSYASLPPAAASTTASSSKSNTVSSKTSAGPSATDVEPSPTLVRSMIDLFATTEDSHPFQALVATEPNNPRLAVLNRYLGLLQFDDADLCGCCIYCLSNEDLAPEQRNKKYPNFLQHFMKCELQHNPNTFRCPLCGDLLPAAPKLKGSEFATISNAVVDPDMDDEERVAVHESMCAHLEACYAKFWAVLSAEEGAEEDEEEGLDVDGMPVAGAAGPTSSSAAARPLSPTASAASTVGSDVDMDTSASRSASRTASRSASRRGSVDTALPAHTPAPPTAKPVSSASTASSKSVSKRSVRSASHHDSDVSMASGAEDSDVSMRSVLSIRSVVGSRQKFNTDIDDGGAGARVLSVELAFTQRFQGRAYRTQTYYFCPIDLFNTDLPWHERLMPMTDINKLMMHIVTHYNKPSQRKDKHNCGFPACQALDEMALRPFIEHLHKVHGYKLIQCTTHCDGDTCDPQKCTVDHHDANCFTLPKKFLFHDDARIMADERMGSARKDLPAATLADYRKQPFKNERARDIFGEHDIAEGFTLDKLVKPSKKAAPKTSNLPTIDPQTLRLQTCLFAVKERHEEFKSLNVKMLTDAGISLEALAVVKSKNDMPACGMTWTFAAFSLFMRAVREWLQESEIEDCVKMLTEAYPELVASTVAASINRSKLKLADLHEMTADDAKELGFDVTDLVWNRMKDSIEAWSAERSGAGDN